MAEKQQLTELDLVMSQIGRDKNFLLSGGAGSGKTYSLVQVIGKVLADNPKTKIGCLTYTNAAVNEIERRVNHTNLRVSTIHDFLWDILKNFQRELKSTLVELINADSSSISVPDISISEGYFDQFQDGIQYKEWTRVRDGIISHDEVILLAHAMFYKYKLLCNLLSDKYPYIFVDEYQDTHPLVIDILLEQLGKSTKPSIIGFFGDSMQSIYDDSIGDLNTYIQRGDVIEVRKQQNRRNPTTVINLANKLRIDRLRQEPSKDPTAPNMSEGGIKQGQTRFCYGTNIDIDEVKQMIGWNFEDVEETRELNLTHNLIAPRAKFEELMNIYDKDKIIEYKSKILSRIKTQNITTDFSAMTFGEVIEALSIAQTPKQSKFIKENQELYEYACSLPFSSFAKSYVDKEALIDDKKTDTGSESKKGSKRDNLIKHLFKIQNQIIAYQTGDINTFLRRTEFKILKHENKLEIRKLIETISSMDNQTIEEVIDYAHDSGLCFKDDKFLKFIGDNEYLYHRVKDIPYMQFKKLYEYLEGKTPFSTQHKIKGEEFTNVLVILDNGDWSKYNFEYVLNPNIKLTAAKQKTFPKIRERTLKLFYVCCTRAKDNLLVYFDSPSEEVIAGAQQLFGDENVINIQNINL